MRILLIETNDIAKWVGGRAGGKNVHVLPIALMGLAAYVEREVPGTEVRIIESSVDAPDDAALGRELDAFRPDLVGLRSINFFRDEARRIVRAVRAWGGVPVVVGGPIATAMGATLFEWIPELELAAVGDGEHSLAALARGEPPASIPGLLVRGPLGPRSVGAATSVADLDTLPLPAYGSVDLARYARTLSYAYNQRRQGVLVTSRGCPYRCTYCYQPPHTKVRLRSAESVFREIEALVRDHDVRDFYVVDDIFNVHRRRALHVFDRLVEARLGARLYFVNGLRVDLCDERFVDRMVEAGTVWVAYAIESAHPRIAALIKKEIDLPRAHRVIAHTQRAGIVVNINTMYGFPTETPSEAQVTLDWLGTLPHASLLPYHFNLRGFHGCEVVEQAEAAGWEREAFLATGFQSYNDLPLGSPTFSRQAMMAHAIEYHQRFGVASRDHLAWSVRVLRNIGYSDAELVDMYSVLLNRRVAAVAELEGQPATESTRAASLASTSATIDRKVSSLPRAMSAESSSMPNSVSRNKTSLITPTESITPDDTST